MGRLLGAAIPLDDERRWVVRGEWTTRPDGTVELTGVHVRLRAACICEPDVIAAGADRGACGCGWPDDSADPSPLPVGGLRSRHLRAVRLEGLSPTHGGLRDWRDWAWEQFGRPKMPPEAPWQPPATPRPPGRPRRRLRPLAALAAQVQRHQDDGCDRGQIARKLGMKDAALRDRLAEAREAELIAPAGRGQWRAVQLTERGRRVLEQGGDV